MYGSDQHAAASGPLTITIAAAQELAAARVTLRAWLRANISGEQADEVLLASGEALANALEHGRVPVTLHVDWADGALRLTVRDAGASQVSADVPARDQTRGLGIPIMTALSDSLTFETTDGTAVTMSRRFTT